MEESGRNNHGGQGQEEEGGKKKGSWGGRRAGAGRPKGSGTGPSPDSRRNRVAVMFRDTELKTLTAMAKREKVPVATTAYRIVERALKRRP